MCGGLGRAVVTRGWISAPLLPDVVTDFDFSPFDQLLLATGSADETVSARCRGDPRGRAVPTLVCPWASLQSLGRWMQRDGSARSLGRRVPASGSCVGTPWGVGDGAG